MTHAHWPTRQQMALIDWTQTVCLFSRLQGGGDRDSWSDCGKGGIYCFPVPMSGQHLVFDIKKKFYIFINFD